MSGEIIRNALPVNGSSNNPINSPIRFDIYADGVQQEDIYLRVLDGVTERIIINRGSVEYGSSVRFEEVSDGFVTGLRVTYIPDDDTYGSTVVWQVDIVRIADVSCRFSYSIESFRIPDGDYQISYDSGINISVDKYGDWMYLGSAASKLRYGTDLGMPPMPIRYGSGYKYGTSLQADAIIDEFVIFNTMRKNVDLNSNENADRSPAAMYNNNQPIKPSRETLMLAHLDGCIKNEAPYYASRNNLFLVDGKYNEAVILDSAPIVISNINKFNPNEGAIEFWVKRNCINSGSLHYLFDAEPLQTIFSPSGNTVPTSSSTRLIDAGIEFLDLGIQAGDVIKIESGSNIGTYTIDEIVSNTEVVLTDVLVADSRFQYSLIRKNSITKNFSIYIDESDYLTFLVTDKVSIPQSNLPSPISSIRTIVTNPECVDPCCDSTEDDVTTSFTETINELVDADYSRNEKYIVSTYVGDWQDDEWHHVAVTYKLNDVITDDLNNHMKLYVDGVEKGVLKLKSNSYYINNNLANFIDRVLKRVTVDGVSYSPGDSPTDAEVEEKLQEYFTDVVSPNTSLTYTQWKNRFNSIGNNKFGLEAFDINSIRGIESINVDFSATSYSQIYLGSDLNGSNLALSAMDDFRISRFTRSTDEIRVVATSLNAAAEEIGITRTKLNFDADTEKITDFTFLRNNRSSKFEFEVEVLNDFGFPLDKELITQLINIIKPAHSRAIVRFKDD